MLKDSWSVKLELLFEFRLNTEFKYLAKLRNKGILFLLLNTLYKSFYFFFHEALDKKIK
jgi:hypothetical protein